MLHVTDNMVNTCTMYRDNMNVTCNRQHDEHMYHVWGITWLHVTDNMMNTCTMYRDNMNVTCNRQHGEHMYHV